MERIGEMIRRVPPFTRYWSLALLTTSVITALKLTSYMNLVFKPDKSFTTQPWRLITSFCYINDFSIELIFSVWVISQSCRNIEESFITHKSLFPPLNRRQQIALDSAINRCKTADFLYYILQICVCIILVVSYGFYQLNFKVPFLGPVLEDILLYIWCRSNSHLDINLFGLILMRRAYLPWFTTLVNLLLNVEFLSEIFNIILGNYSRVYYLFRNEYFWKIFITYSISHFWWFIREFAINDLYHTKDDLQRSLRQQTFKEYNVPTSNGIKRILTLLLLPPWYWIVLEKLKYIPDDEIEEDREEHVALNEAVEGEI